jgi:hypothetical protein
MQPRVPIGGVYYSLDRLDDVKKQVDLANKYGIYGFNIYHYWFSTDRCLLTKPAEIIINHPELNINYMFTWDNGSWKRTWSAVKHANDWAPMSDKNIATSKEGEGILIALDYGKEEDWIKHFEYLLNYFKDIRYIKEDNKPLFGIFNPDNTPEVLRQMITCWDDLARHNGFDGIKVLCKNNHGENTVTPYSFTYEPGNSAWETRSITDKFVKKIGDLTKPIKPKVYSYGNVWKNLIQMAERNTDNGLYYGCFVNFDDTPRRGARGRIIDGGSPKIFEQFLKQLTAVCEKKNKSILFITAWNEWSEGAFLEPDEANGFAYLEALSQALKD